MFENLIMNRQSDYVERNTIFLQKFYNELIYLQHLSILERDSSIEEEMSIEQLNRCIYNISFKAFIKTLFDFR